MQELFKKYNIELQENEEKLFLKFLEIFKAKNSSINLSSIRDDEWIIEKHFIDSIFLNIFFDIKWKILDLWTGWGFPGIPLKIVNQKDTDFILVDSIGKKVKAVNEFIQELNLENIKAIQGRAEELWHDENYREKFDIVISRATSYLPTLLEYVSSFLKLWWIFIAYKLDDKKEIADSKKAFHVLNLEIINTKKYEINWQKRVLIFIQKIGETPKKYPRPIWEPLKSPLL